jgi:uncharacterized protein (DUF58 family)
MVRSDVLRQVRRIELAIRRRLRGSQAGGARSAVKGSGFDLHQIREYSQGDDVRCIDWKGTARTGRLLVKECYEERNRTIVILVDASASLFFGSQNEIKYSIIAQAAATIGLSGAFHKDRVSIVLVHRDVRSIPQVVVGQSGVMNMLRHVIQGQEREPAKNIDAVLQQLVAQYKKNALVFVMSDFLDNHWIDSLKNVSKLFEIVAIRCLDRQERAPGFFGPLHVQDSETGFKGCMHSTSVGRLACSLNNMIALQDKKLAACGIDCVDLSTTDDFIDDLVVFLRKRLQRRR